MEWIEFVLAAIAGIIVAYVIYKIYVKIKAWQGKQYQPEKATSFTCADGHLVRSKGELIIDNWLTQHNIAHEYEKTISVHGHSIKYDWLLKDSTTYVEYWGYSGRTYMRRKQEKLRLYKQGNLNLISIEDKDLENIYKKFPPKFAPFAKTLDISSDKGKFCPHCGEALDKRFR